MGPIGAAALLATRCLIFRFPEPEIYLPPGTDMKLSVSVRPENVLSGSEAPDPPTSAPAELSDWIREQPAGIERPNGKPAGDLINVAFVGSRQQLLDAFTVAGWSTADPSTIKNYSRMYGAFNTMRDYSSAPVSTLLYRGNEPDLVFEKSLDTVSKRHHARVWQAGIVDGQEVWVGAATHDTGISFNLRTASFTHKIDENIDEERDKVSTDLIFAGCSPHVGPISRPEFAATGDKSSIGTDGAVAVLNLQSCSRRDDLDESTTPPLSGNKLKRLTRRIVLEARNYVLRENPYYWGYQLIRHAHGDRSPETD